MQFFLYEFQENFVVKAILFPSKTSARALLSFAFFAFSFFSAASHAENYELDSGISYNFQDISTTGTTLIENCDDCARAVEIGFEFTYYGRVYTQLYVASNGFVLPGGSAPEQGGRMGCCDGRNIPQVDNMVGVMALWWTDLSLKAQEASSAKEEDGKIYTELLGSPGSHVFIVQFNKVRHFHNLATDDENTFQLKIFENDNHIEFHYKNLVANKNIHTIGIESPRQDEGRKFFRTSKTTPLPAKTKEFALSFIPPENVKLTSSLRYGAEGNKLSHIFEVNQNVDDITDIEFSDFPPSGILTNDIDFLNAELKSNNPARFALDYTLEETLNEAAGTISADLIDFKINGGDFLSLESQTVLISQTKLVEHEEFTVTDATMNDNATVIAYKSKNNLLEVIGKSELAADVFFVGRDTDTLAGESYQLTSLSASDECGMPYIDHNDDYSYLFVMCTTGEDNNEIELIRYDLDSYLDDDLTQTQITVPGSVHDFSGIISEQALVVSAANNVAYGRDVGGGLQAVFLNGSKVNSTDGVLKSLAIDSSGEKLVYVLGDTAYLYTDSTETVIATGGVKTVDISSDGTLIVFDSTSNTLPASDNGDLSSEIFTVPAVVPFAGYVQKTNLFGGECKLPSLSEKGQRIIMVCNQDLLNLGNDFTDDREAIFVIETLNETEVVHLISSLPDAISNIQDLVMSSDGASVFFEDGDEENAFRLSGLAKLDSKLEENTAKNYPIPFKIPGDGKSGTIFFLNLLFLMMVLVLRNKNIFNRIV